MRPALAALSLCSLVAHAEPAWTSARGSVPGRTTVSAFVGPRTVGAALELPRAELQAVAFEAAWLHLDRVLELRSARSWQLTRGRAAFSASAGLTGLFVPQDQLDLGLGPHVGITLALGGRTVALQLGASSGVELFARGSVRFVERLHLGTVVRFGRFHAGVTASAGADFSPGRNFTVRADAILFVALDASRQVVQATPPVPSPSSR